MFVKVKCTTGRMLDVEVGEEDYVESIKRKIKEMAGLVEDQQKLLFNGKPLKSGILLKKQNVVSGSVLHLVLNLRGG